MNFSFKAIVAAVVISISATAYTAATMLDKGVVTDTKGAEAVAQLKVIKDKEQADVRLGQYVLNMMFKSPTTIKELSPARMQVLAQAIVRVANDIFDNEAEKHGFIGALQIESRFLKYAQSPTGPKGLSQVARATFHYALKNCGIDNAKDDDVWETDLNLYAGACYYKEQLLNNNGDIVAAIVAYNQGPESEDAKRYPKDGVIKKPEPLAYVTKFGFNRDHTTDTKMPGVPALSELPKPIKPSKKTN